MFFFQGKCGIKQASDLHIFAIGHEEQKRLADKVEQPLFQTSFCKVFKYDTDPMRQPCNPELKMSIIKAHSCGICEILRQGPIGQMIYFEAVDFMAKRYVAFTEFSIHFNVWLGFNVQA